MGTSEAASFWQENEIVITILLRVIVRMAEWRKQVLGIYTNVGV